MLNSSCWEVIAVFFSKLCAVLWLVTQLCPTPCNPMDCSSPGPSVHRRVSRQEYWSGLPCPPPGDLPNPGIEHRPPTLGSGRSRPPCRGLDCHFPQGSCLQFSQTLPWGPQRGGEGSEIASVPLLPGARCWLQCPESDRKPCSAVQGFTAFRRCPNPTPWPSPTAGAAFTHFLTVPGASLWGQVPRWLLRTHGSKAISYLQGAQS